MKSQVFSYKTQNKWCTRHSGPNQSMKLIIEVELQILNTPTHSHKFKLYSYRTRNQVPTENDIKIHDIKTTKPVLQYYSSTDIMVSKIILPHYEVLTSASSAQVRWPIIPLFRTLKSDTNPSIHDLMA